jgi:hypothetical protein
MSQNRFWQSLGPGEQGPRASRQPPSSRDRSEAAGSGAIKRPCLLRLRACSKQSRPAGSARTTDHRTGAEPYTAPFAKLAAISAPPSREEYPYTRRSCPQEPPHARFRGSPHRAFLPRGTSSPRRKLPGSARRSSHGGAGAGSTEEEADQVLPPPSPPAPSLLFPPLACLLSAHAVVASPWACPPLPLPHPPSRCGSHTSYARAVQCAEVERGGGVVVEPSDGHLRDLPQQFA